MQLAAWNSDNLKTFIFALRDKLEIKNLKKYLTLRSPTPPQVLENVSFTCFRHWWKILVPLKSVSVICLSMAEDRYLGGQILMSLKLVKSHVTMTPSRALRSELIFFCMFPFHWDTGLQTKIHTQICSSFSCMPMSVEIIGITRSREQRCVYKTRSQNPSVEECWVNFSSKYQLKVM